MDKLDKIIEVKLQELWPWKKRERVNWKVYEPTKDPRPGWGNNIVTEIPSQKCVVAFYKVPETSYLALVICVPHNVNDPYDYEAGRTSDIFAKKLYWRRFPTGGAGNKKYIEFESEDGLSDNGPWYFDSLSKVIKHCKSLKSESMIIEDFICTTTINVNFNSEPEVTALRAIRYELTNVSSKLIGSKLVFEAKDLVHDYTSFTADRGYFLDPKLKVLGIEKLKEQFANPDPFPHTPSDPTWNTGVYAPSTPIKDRRDIDDEKEEEDKDTKIKEQAVAAIKKRYEIQKYREKMEGCKKVKDIAKRKKCIADYTCKIEAIKKQIKVIVTKK